LANDLVGGPCLVGFKLFIFDLYAIYVGCKFA